MSGVNGVPLDEPYLQEFLDVWCGISEAVDCSITTNVGYIGLECDGDGHVTSL